MLLRTFTLYYTLFSRCRLLSLAYAIDAESLRFDAFRHTMFAMPVSCELRRHAMPPPDYAYILISRHYAITLRRHCRVTPLIATPRHYATVIQGYYADALTPPLFDAIH